jgi:hypothetical protein
MICLRVCPPQTNELRENKEKQYACNKSGTVYRL